MTLINPKLKSLMLAVALPFLSFAGSKTDTTGLTAISKKMYDEGNHKYILADAVKDGLLQDRKPFSYEYDNGMLKINGKEIPEKYRLEYARKMEAFLLKKQGNTHAKFSMYANKLSLDNMVREEGSYRKEEVKLAETNERQEKQKELDALVNEMAEDGLVKDKEYLKIKWNNKGLYVDGKKLEGATEKKYAEKMEAAVGFKPRKASDSYYYTRKSHG